MMQNYGKDGRKGQQPAATLKIVDSRYHIKDIFLGEGAFGKVYACWDSFSKQVLAVKTIEKAKLVQRINKSKSKSETKQFYIKSLQDQANLMKILHHSNIIKFYGISQTPTFIYFYLQYCNMGNLSNYLKKQKNLKFDTCLNIMRQLVRAVKYIHEKGICHRDIKPLNILMHNNTPKLCDFGFAFNIQEEENVTTHYSVGTEQFMSPQVYLQQPFTLKCDIWSLGVTFYSILYGRTPWNKTYGEKQWLNPYRRGVEYPQSVFVPGWLRLIIDKMLAYNQADRLSINDVRNLFRV